MGTKRRSSAWIAALSSSMRAWKIFCGRGWSTLSATEPTNIPCVRFEIFDGGISASSCVLVEWVMFSFETDCDSRNWTILPKRSESVRAVSPTTCPEKMLPTVLKITFASLSP